MKKIFKISLIAQIIFVVIPYSIAIIALYKFGDPIWGHDPKEITGKSHMFLALFPNLEYILLPLSVIIWGYAMIKKKIRWYDTTTWLLLAVIIAFLLQFWGITYSYTMWFFD